MLPAFMVESNNDEERLARIEKMIEALQRESDTVKSVAGKLIDVIQASPLLVPGRIPLTRSAKPKR
jgi:hypothetical protein